MPSLPPSPLLAGIDRQTAASLLTRLGASQRRYSPGAQLLRAGETTAAFGLVLSGQAQVFREDRQGRPTLIALLHPGSEVALLLAAAGRPSPVTVQATSEMTVLQIPFDALLAASKTACPGADLLLRNYLRATAAKGLLLHQRLDCLLQPTVREKVLTYLHRVAAATGSRAFTLPLHRADLAAYLHVERSALSRELSRMRQDGLLDFRKNHFRLL